MKFLPLNLIAADPVSARRAFRAYADYLLTIWERLPHAIQRIQGGMANPDEFPDARLWITFHDADIVSFSHEDLNKRIKVELIADDNGDELKVELRYEGVESVSEPLVAGNTILYHEIEVTSGGCFIHRICQSSEAISCIGFRACYLQIGPQANEPDM